MEAAIDEKEGECPMVVTFMCPHCKKEHMVRQAMAFSPDTDNAAIQVQMEDADFYDTEALDKQEDVKAQLEQEYGRSVDFVFAGYSGWCLRSKSAES